MENQVDLKKAEGAVEGEVRSLVEGTEEPPKAQPGAETPEEDPIEKMSAALEQARSETAEKHDLYLRKVAEFENFRRRRDREFEETIRLANEGLISRLLPVLENFERALNHHGSGESLEAYRQGVELIVQQFRDVLRREGLELVESVGQPFDPNLHEALMQAHSDAHEPGLVCEEVERGYRLRDRVIRHAKVVVSLGPREAEGQV